MAATQPMTTEEWIADQLAKAPRPTDAQIDRAVALLKAAAPTPKRA